MRSLSSSNGLIDFSSNDYLGFSSSSQINQITMDLLRDFGKIQNGSKGSRLLNGNHSLFKETENLIAQFHRTESALIFNSGYDSNIGFFSCVPQRGDLILYDALVHASIRDGIKMSVAHSQKFKHNDLVDLDNILRKKRLQNNIQQSGGDIYIVTESVFSMDGDVAPMQEMVEIIEKHNCYLIVDEAHAVGVFGEKGEGLVQMLQLENKVFARIVTFGKALGCHGAAVLGSDLLRDYLINYSRSFIYTTALPPHAIANILAAYKTLTVINLQNNLLENLSANIQMFKSQLINYGLESRFIKSESAIHCCLIPGNDEVKRIAELIQEEGFDVKPILSPTVPKGKERIRLCIHSYNTSREIDGLVKQLVNFIQ